MLAFIKLTPWRLGRGTQQAVHDHDNAESFILDRIIGGQEGAGEEESQQESPEGKPMPIDPISGVDPNSGNPDDYWDDQASKSLEAMDTMARHPNNNPRLYSKHVVDLDAGTFKITLNNNLSEDLIGKAMEPLARGMEHMREVAFTVSGNMHAFFKSAVLYREFTGEPWFMSNPLRSSRLRKMQRKWARHRGSPLVGYIDLTKADEVRANYRVAFQDSGVQFDG